MQNCIGGASTTFHMLNEESRKYFKRAIVMSGSVYSYFAFTATNHVKNMEECSLTKRKDQMIEYMQKADVRDLFQCYFRDDWGKTLKPEWVPTIEPKDASNGFLTECPTDIWTSSKAPVVDTLFTMVSQVCFIKSRFQFCGTKCNFHCTTRNKQPLILNCLRKRNR